NSIIFAVFFVGPEKNTAHRNFIGVLKCRVGLKYHPLMRVIKYRLEPPEHFTSDNPTGPFGITLCILLKVHYGSIKHERTKLNSFDATNHPFLFSGRSNTCALNAG